MNVTMFGAVPNKGTPLFAGNLPMMRQGMPLKSTQEKMERQQKAADQIGFWENKKETLKNMPCSTVEEIAERMETGIDEYYTGTVVCNAGYKIQGFSFQIDPYCG